jgi:hypothetical protein
VALHRVNEGGKQGLEPLATDPIGGFPEHDERLSHVLVVEAIRPPPIPRRRRLCAKHANGVLAVIAGQAKELLEDGLPFHPSARTVSRSHHLDELFARRHADSPRHVLPPPIDPAGNKLREATASLR